MPRRHTLTVHGERFLGNRSKKEVHDLDRETSECHIDSILQAENAEGFDELEDAFERGYDCCNNCLPECSRGPRQVAAEEEGE